MNVGSMKNASNEVNTRLSAVELKLNSKRDNNTLIEKRDLSNELLDVIETTSEVESKLNKVLVNIDTVSEIPPGDFIGLNRLLKIAAKPLFLRVVTSGRDAQIEQITPGNDGDIAIAIKTMHVFVAERQGGNLKFVLDEDYFNKHPECQNAFIVSKQDNSIRGYIYKNEIVGLSIGTDIEPRRVTLSPNTGDTFQVLDALYKDIKIFAKDKDKTSPTYGKNIPADAYVSIACDEDSYTIHNYSDEELELTIMEK